MIRILLIFAIVLVGCGTAPKKPEPQAEKVEAPKLVTYAHLTDDELIDLSHEALEGYFSKKFPEVWEDTKVDFVSNEEVNKVCGMQGKTGCCHRVKENDYELYIDEALDSLGRCVMLVHEYMHAIGDMVYGDPDHDHKKYSKVFDEKAGLGPVFCQSKLKER